LSPANAKQDAQYQVTRHAEKINARRMLSLFARRSRACCGSGVLSAYAVLGNGDHVPCEHDPQSLRDSRSIGLEAE
jgi:hypothetical protein